VFRYEGLPSHRNTTRSKSHVVLGKTDLYRASVQIVRGGGANNLHSHTGNDGFWFVLSGRARFYGEGDELYAELGPNEGIVMPRNTPYWFEPAGDAELEILHLACFAQAEEDRRIDHAARNRAASDDVVEISTLVAEAGDSGTPGDPG